jgi:hypothetical protein
MLSVIYITNSAAHSCVCLGTSLSFDHSSVLHAAGVTNIHSAAEAAEALRPLAGDLTFVLFARVLKGRREQGLQLFLILAGPKNLRRL